MPEPPLLQYKMIPGPSYYRAMSFLGNIPRAADTVPMKEVNKAGSEIVRLARQNVNTRTGNLESTIRVEITGRNQIVVRAGGKMGSGTPPKFVNYAAWVEYGHGGPRPAGPHPYMMPAILAVMSGDSGTGDGPLGPRILQNIIREANVRTTITAPIISRQAGSSLGGLLALSAVAMTAVSGIYAGIT
jgi:hypothetical protein